ncbi:MAG TPA: hypothetical protein VJ717_16345, partial [Gemmatimonadaceae bacterium]|nr:hypothetical protein [Gemmatimonadaceae bacterium]
MPDHEAELSPTMRVRAQADVLYRAATECVRQRGRYSNLVASSAADSELDSAWRVVSLCDELLTEAVGAYEDAVAKDGGAASETWWHQANALWHSSREYTRRHREVEESSRRLGAHNPSKLTELALQYDLEASSLLALDHAVASYRKCCPEAEQANGAKRARAG